MTNDGGAAPADAPSRRHPASAELAGWAAALAIATVVVAVVATASDWLLYTDGDSVIVPMIVQSVVQGQTQDWAMSPVLFLPETVVYGMLSLFGLGMRATLTLNAVVNLLALYGAIRLVAGRRGPGRAPVVGAVIALAAFGLLAILEGAASSPGFQLATLMATTTYYSATVVAVVAVVGLTRRLLDGARPVAPLVAIAVVGLVSVVTNPLFAVWAVAPVCAVLIALAAARVVPLTTAAIAGAALVGGSLVGYLLRGAFGDTIVAAEGNYFRADRWAASRDYFGMVFGQTSQTWHGMLWLLAIAALTAASATVAVRAWRRRDGARAFVGAVAVVSPVATTIGAILLGSDADRYLQPWVFLPVLVVAIAPPPLPQFGRAARVATAAVGGILVVVVLALSGPPVVQAATRADADLDCVVGWVEASGRTGAGQFWTVRAPKADLDDPTRLIQVDHTLRVYTWLTNRTDADGAQVTFLLQSADSQQFALPEGFSLEQAIPVTCGRYTIFDFGDRVLPLGPPRN